MATLFGKTAGDWNGAQAFTSTLNGTDYAVPGTGDTVILNNKNMTLAATSASLAVLTNAAVSSAAAGGKVTLMNNGVLRTALITVGTVNIVDVDANATNAILEATTITHSSTANIHAIVCGVNRAFTVRGVGDTAGTFTGGTGVSTAKDNSIFNISSTQNTTIKGNITAGSATYCYGLYNTSSGTVTITGNISSGTANTTHGIYSTSTGAIDTTGNVTTAIGGNSTSYGMYITGAADITVHGNITTVGGSAINHASSGTITVHGNITPAAQYGVYASSGANIIVEGDVRGGSSSSGMGVVCSLSGNVTITGTVTGGTVSSNTYGVSRSGTGTLTITGAVSGGSVGASSANGVYISGTGQTTIDGNVTAGGSSTAYGVYVMGTGGPVYITGNATASIYSPAVFNDSNAYVTTIEGNVTGGTTGASAGSYGARNTSTGGMTVIGNVTGGLADQTYGLFAESTGPINITGNCVSTLYSHGVYCDTGAQVTITGDCIGNNWTYGSPGGAYFGAVILNDTKGILHGNVVNGTYGVPGYVGYISRDVAYPINSITVPYINTSTQAVTVDTLYSAIGMNAAVLPQHIRSGYEIGTVTGTLAVPPAASVASGVPVDATVGTATLTAQAIRDAFAINVTGGTTPTSGSIDTLLTNISAKTTNLPASPAAVGSAMTLASSAITSTAYDRVTAFPLNVSQTNVLIPGTVDTTAFTSTITEFESDDITEATTNHYKNRLIVFTSGALAGQFCTISSYILTGGRGHFTVSALTEAPTNDSKFTIY